jgi:hypothetical protein
VLGKLLENKHFVQKEFRRLSIEKKHKAWFDEESLELLDQGK